MENPYMIMIVALAILAIIDLVVGVSNDAVNFLNSAIGSKVISTRNILIIASLGVFVGAITSSGMMEVARKGIFVPAMFNFQNIMYIFMAVMITDILLLDVFNTLGMPTSTTVSIVFELLGAAVVMALIKISADPENAVSIWEYINYSKASMIIFGILLSVVVAFTIGAFVQFISRMLFTFKIGDRDSIVTIIFGGFALATISYFILFKGFKGTTFYKEYNVKQYLEDNFWQIFAIAFIIWTFISFIISKFTKFNILHIIIGVGTFSLALAFSGNDLVNFVGVPIAAWNSYQEWAGSGVDATEFSMGVLGKKVPSNNLLLLAAGAIMVVTIWFSKKAKEVIKTGIDLSRQDEGQERFKPTLASKVAVRFAMGLNKFYETIIPKSTQNWVNSRFERPNITFSKNKKNDKPAFDTVRASVNLVVAGILISIGTSKGLPLSTTYVTFMVAMGTSLADRAWGRESAVYRVAGVLSVISGWFLTALTAFTVAGIFVYIINLGGITSVILLFALVLFLIVKNTLKHRKKTKALELKRSTEKAEIKTIKVVMKDSSERIADVTRRVDKLYGHVVTDLSAHNLNKLSKTKKHVKKLNEDLDELRNNVFYFIKSLDDSSAKASRFYIHVLDYLQDVMQSIDYISSTSFIHVDNNHKNLKKSQIQDLKSIQVELSQLLHIIQTSFENKDYTHVQLLNDKKENLFDNIAISLDNQVDRIRTEESSKRNTTLYFGILLETKDLVRSLISLMVLFDKYSTLYKKDDTKIIFK
jgi:phosphate/sulfate permease